MGHFSTLLLSKSSHSVLQVNSRGIVKKEGQIKPSWGSWEKSHCHRRVSHEPVLSAGQYSGSEGIQMLKVPRGMTKINGIAALECKEISASAGTCLEASHGKLPARAKDPGELAKVPGQLYQSTGTAHPTLQKSSKASTDEKESSWLSAGTNKRTQKLKAGTAAWEK